MTAKTINLDGTTGTTGTTDNGTDVPPETGPGTAPPRTPQFTKLEGQLRDFYAQAGTYLGMMSPDPVAGLVIAANAEAAASAWTDLAAQDRRVKDALERLLTGGVWANVIGIHLAGIALPILAYYGKLPEQAQGPVLMMMASNPTFAPFVQAKFGGNTA